MGKAHQITDFSSRENRQIFYQSSEWRKLREYVLSISPFCVECGKKGITRAAVVADHLTEIQYSPSQRLNPNNIQTLCAQCHNEKSANTLSTKDMAVKAVNPTHSVEIKKLKKL